MYNYDLGCAVCTLRAYWAGVPWLSPVPPVSYYYYLYRYNKYLRGWRGVPARDSDIATQSSSYAHKQRVRMFNTREYQPFPFVVVIV